MIRDCEEFNTIDAFRVIDYEAKGFVDPNELIKALNVIGVNFNDDDIILFFQKYDKDENRKLKYSSFCDAIAPKEESYVRELAAR